MKCSLTDRKIQQTSFQKSPRWTRYLHCKRHFLRWLHYLRLPAGVGFPDKQGKFIKRVVFNEEEANIMRHVFEQYDKGVSKKQIAADLNAADLNAQGCKVKEKPVTHKTFNHYLTNSKYRGEFYFGDRLRTSMYPAIIDRATFKRVQKRLADNRYFLSGTETAKEPYLLTGNVVSSIKLEE